LGQLSTGQTNDGRLQKHVADRLFISACGVRESRVSTVSGSEVSKERRARGVHSGVVVVVVATIVVECCVLGMFCVWIAACWVIANERSNQYIAQLRECFKRVSKESEASDVRGKLAFA
jgi:hypothetical protein